MKLEMHRWADISSNYTDSVILGNGASISVAPTLSYRSLYEAAIGYGHLTESQQAIFALFKTHDFEFVMRALSHASAINQHLRIVETATAQAYEQIKQALIRTVEKVHPEYGDAEIQLPAISRFLSHFSTVFSLNYDLLIYWAIMAEISRPDGSCFMDCFIHGRFKTEYPCLRPSDGTPSTFFFYPHGNLALATDMLGEESKIQRRTSALISEIKENWELRGGNPLFVSEGDSSKKLLAIGRSSYLQAVYSELCAIRESVLIYGWSFGTEDSHILKALGRARVRLLGISVYKGEGSAPEHFCYEVDRAVRGTSGLEKAHIEFFDSSDPGAWIHPPL